jgi:hypothetical protein
MSKLFIYSIVVVSWVCGVTSAQAKTVCMATTNAEIADRIANGHSWRKHRSEFVAGKVIAGLEMPATPKVTTVAKFKSHILSVMSSPTNKALFRSRKAYWLPSTGTIVFYDPKSVDCGTAFRPGRGKSYYDNQL